ncbi:nucleotidyltransferase domain-containing protein [Methyloglobulus sp.]|uniref:DNA polymerase beta superfamily protein n=1 Tax=Methyloglobulus sp. TaxID=2518622 RepID=UPI0032B71158
MNTKPPVSLTIDDLKQQNLIVLDTVSGSKAYGLDTPQSDTDTRGVFILPQDLYFGFNYLEQVSSDKNDHVYYELGKYLKLLAKNNPSSIELLYAPGETIVYRHPLMTMIKPEIILSRLCRDSFAGYAMGQVKKAKGLNKKVFNPISEQMPRPFDCCFIVEGDRTIPVEEWLTKHQLQPERCGLSALPHVKDGYTLFYADDCNNDDVRFNGLFRSDANQDKSRPSQDVCLSSIPKGMQPRAWLVFNKDEYSRRLRDYHEYRQWEQARNPDRYKLTLEHGGGYDAKNMMHTFRLLRMAKEIATTGKPLVRRPDREELLDIKSGRFAYDDLMAKAAEELRQIDACYAISNLPDETDDHKIEQ